MPPALTSSTELLLLKLSGSSTPNFTRNGEAMPITM
jgi:hypothetical protein